MSKFFSIIKADTQWDFVAKAPLISLFSAVTVVVCLVGMFTKGFNLGIDFTGGTVIQMKFSEPQQNQQVVELMSSLGEQGASVVALGRSQKEFLVTVRTVIDEEVQKAGKHPLPQQVVEKVGADKVEILKSDVVGPKVGSELKRSAMRSLFYSIFFIMLYIWFRFDASFAPGATIAMIHDLIIMCGFYVFSGEEFTITSIAALLTVAGYSVNDTIVIYDRVRDMFKSTGEDLDLRPTLNRAINATLSRTIVTSLLTLIAVAALVFLCTGEIQSFAMAVCLGVLVGTYSTVFIAAPFTLLMDKWAKHSELKKAEQGRWKKTT